MQNKKSMFYRIISIFSALFMCLFCGAYAGTEKVDDTENADLEKLSAESVENFESGESLFQQITTLEQEKVLMQLEKERAQLDLELDRLAAEKIKLSMEIDTLSGRADQQQKEIENERAKLEAEAKKLESERESLMRQVSAPVVASPAPVADSVAPSRVEVEKPVEDISKLYKLVNVLGAGSQLQATLEDLGTGQNKRVSVGKTLSGFTVKSISLDEGVVFVKDGDTQTLNIANR